MNLNRWSIVKTNLQTCVLNELRLHNTHRRCLKCLFSLRWDTFSAHNIFSRRPSFKIQSLTVRSTRFAWLTFDSYNESQIQYPKLNDFSLPMNSFILFLSIPTARFLFDALRILFLVCFSFIQFHLLRGLRSTFLYFNNLKACVIFICLALNLFGDFDRVKDTE